VKDGKVLVKCLASGNCTQDGVVSELKKRDLWQGGGEYISPSEHVKRETPGRNGSKPSSKQAKNSSSTSRSTPETSETPGTSQSLTLEELAKAKMLPVSFLKSLGLSQIYLDRTPVVRIPYYSQDGGEAASRFRLALSGEERFRWKSGSRVMPYGPERLNARPKAQEVLLVEGESDCWTCWLHEIPAIGIPGKGTWKGEWAQYLEGITVYVWQEPGAEDFVGRIGADLPNAYVILAPADIKDLSEAHLQGKDVARFLAELKASVIPISRLLALRRSAAMAEAALRAHAAFASPDVLSLLEKSVQGMSYSGDKKPLKQVYLGMTTRLLDLRKSQMPAHILVEGPSSAGKSYTVDMAALHLPEEAVHKIEAGSPRAIIYDNADLSHKVLIFGEADSLPQGEDNSAASAIRGLAQDGYLHYDVVVRDEKTSEFVTKHIRKPGPTVLITTSTRSLGKQMMTRLFTVEVSTEPTQVRAALLAQARADDAAQGPDEALVALQMYLQLGAPWRVLVPFAGWLAGNVSADDPRVLRDYSRLLVLIKAHALLHLRQRASDKEGRILAEVGDYEAVFYLVRESYAASASDGVSEDVRQVVEIVRVLREEKGDIPLVKQADIVAQPKMNKRKVSRAVNKASRAGWLVDRNNRGVRKQGPMDLALGEPLPDIYALPDPESLRREFRVSPGATRTETWKLDTNQPETGTEREEAQAQVSSFSDD
jgi:hypothetical protein